MKYLIDGGNRLKGEISVCGAKNCVLPLLGATLLTDDCVTLTNCPHIVDVSNMLALLCALGKKVNLSGDVISVWGQVTTTEIPQKHAALLRGSGLVLGSALSRFHTAFLPATGGCAIGSRPIDIHLQGLRALGVDVAETPLGTECCGRPVGAKFTLRFPSVGATENLLCAAVLAKGETQLFNCALEPEVVALEQALVLMGAKISGIGTQNLVIDGVDRLHGVKFAVIPDRIVAATYLSCVAAAGGDVTVTNCNPQHLFSFANLLAKHFALTIGSNYLRLSSNAQPKGYGRVQTEPYPGFPTDAQQLLLSLCALSCGGSSEVVENLFENRLQHNAAQLNLMGGNVVVCGKVAKVTGKRLFGTAVSASDLRGGAGLVVAALGASGQTVVQNAEHLFRGYGNLCCLNELGAKIRLEE